MKYKRLLKFTITAAAGITAAALLSSVFSGAGGGAVPGNAAMRPAGPAASQRTDGLSGVRQDDLGAEGFPTEVPESFALKLKNDRLELYYKDETGEVALKDIASGAVFFSNPQDRESDSYAQGSVKKSIAAQLSVAYFNSDGTQGLMDSANYSAAYNNISASVKGGVLSVSYKIGKEKVTINDVPQQMSQERFEAILSRLSEADASDLKSQYTLVRLNDNDSAKVRETKLQKYKNIASNPIYFLKYETDRVLAKVKGYLDAAGYTTEDLIFDNEENGIEAEVVSIPTFTIVIDYALDGDSLAVTLDTQKMTYQKATPLSEIRVLEYFGAGSPEDRGYLLVPDGSGSLIYFNNLKREATPFSMKIYGKDYATRYTQNYQVDEPARYPACGIKNGGAALLIAMEEGESLAEADAYVSRMRTSYNNVYFTVHPVAVEKVDLSEQSNWAHSMVASQQKPYQGAFRIRYTPVMEDPTYAGMAAAYRGRLLQRGILGEQKASESLPLHLALLGGVSVQKTFMGIAYDAVEPLTDFRQAQDILASLNENGIRGADIRFLGWFNKGVSQQLASSVRVLRALGGADGLAALSRAVAENGGVLYPDTFFFNIYSRGNGYRSNRDNIRSLNRDISVSYFYNPVNGYRNYEMGSIYKLSAGRIGSVVQSFLGGIRPLSLDGICAADLGSDLSSDYSDTSPLSRPESQALAAGALEKIHEQYRVMASDPNLYALPGTDEIVGLAANDSGFDITDLSIPFYPMVLHGYRDYSSVPLNYASDYRNALLQSIEYGAGLDYMLCAEDPSVLKYTHYSFFYTGMADDWMPDCISSYKEAAAALDGLNDLRMVSHRAISETLFCTGYEDGTEVYVNYGGTDVVYAGVTVPAKGYARGRTGQDGQG